MKQYVKILVGIFATLMMVCNKDTLTVQCGRCRKETGKCVFYLFFRALAVVNALFYPISPYFLL
jgi:hypothetical protein